MGVPSDVVGASDHSLAQVWSTPSTSTKTSLTAYPILPASTRSDASRYDRAVGKLEATAAPRLLDCRAELASILDDLEIAIV